jgi:hypothetical protein
MGPRPLRKWARILSTVAGSVITAITFIVAPHRAQRSGSTSKIFRMSRAQFFFRVP